MRRTRRRRRHGLAGAWGRRGRHGLCHSDRSPCGMPIRDIADEKLRLVEKVIQGRDFTAMVETVNAVDAWLGSLPGHAYANVRQPPISTLNLAHMIPLSAVWAGPERDEHFGAPPLLYGKTEGSTPFRLVPSCRRCRPHPCRRPDRRGQVRAAGAHGLAVPPLRAARSSPSTSAVRSALRRSPWAATGMILAAG
jgi:hypothetical protein